MSIQTYQDIDRLIAHLILKNKTRSLGEVLLNHSGKKK